MRSAFNVFRFLGSLVWAGIRTWWAFRGERGVEADDPDKEREEGR